MNNNGYTIIELLVTLSITTALVTLTVPSLSEFSNRQQANTEINNYINFFKFARYTAAARTKYISVCAIETPKSCGTDWSKGVIIFEDNNIDGNINENEEIIKLFERVDSNSTITLNASLNSDFINYTPNGTSFRRSISGNLVYCQGQNNTANSKALIFSRAGRVYLAPDNDKNGVPENGSGKNITC